MIEKKWLGVNKLINQYKPPFDRDAIAQIVSDNTGTSKEAVLAGWDAKMNSARICGDAVHKFIEQYIITEGNTPFRPKGYENHCRHFIQWYNAHKRKYNFENTEYSLSDPNYMLRGSIDLVACGLKPIGRSCDNFEIYDYHIFDWKTTESFKHYSDKKMLAPFEHLDDCHLTNVSLQLHIYAILFQQERSHTGAINLHCVNITNFNGWASLQTHNLKDEAMKMIEIRRSYLGKGNENE